MPDLYQWIWVLQTFGGTTLTNLSVLSGASDRKLSYKRSSTPEATAKIDLYHDDAYVLYDALRQGTPILRCFRIESIINGVPIAPCRFCGPVLPLSDAPAEDGGSTVDFTARGAFEFLEGRFVATGQDDVWDMTATGSGDIATALIDESNAELDTGIEIGNIEPTVPRDVEYSVKRVSDAITELASDFDFEVVPIADDSGGGTVFGRFDVFAEQGAGLDGSDAKFGYGAGTLGNCTSYSRKTQRPTNRVIVTGDEGLVAFVEDTVSQARYGLWTETDSISDSVDPGQLEARASELLSPEPYVVVGITPDPLATDPETGEPITPQPWVDYWLGAPISVEIRDGACTYSGEPRVDGIDITLDDDGYESEHGITIADVTGGV